MAESILRRSALSNQRECGGEDDRDAKSEPPKSPDVTARPSTTGGARQTPARKIPSANDRRAVLLPPNPRHNARPRTRAPAAIATVRMTPGKADGPAIPSPQ